MSAILWCVIVAAITAAVVFFVQEHRRKALIGERDDALRARSVAESRLEYLTSDHAVLGEKLVAERAERSAVDKEREQLAGNLQVAISQREAAEAAKVESQALRASLDLERRSLEARVTKLTADNAALESVNQQLQQLQEQQKVWVAEQTKHFKDTVAAEAARIMEERGKAFTDLNRKEVDAVVAPFKEKLEEFRRRIEDIHTTDTRARGQLDERIVSLTNLNRTVSDQAERLVKALTVSSKSTGDWGETILAKILEESGLREDRDYRLQLTIKDADGGDLRPDAVLYLPDDRQLVIDSKVSNKAWAEYCSAVDDGRREASLKEHLASLRAHIKDLSGKEYFRSPDLRTVDFVLMFVPVEAALLTALVKDDSLYSDAYQQRIILVTPTTLMAVVRMALGLWTFQTRMESVETIVEVGRKLYEKFVNFADTFVDVGKAISDSGSAFEKAKGQLSTGRGNAVKLAEQLRSLGVTPSAGKVMPTALLDLDDSSQADDAELSR